MVMQRRLMYIEKGTGYNHDGPAWIGYVDFSRTGRKAYFNGQAFSCSKRFGRCAETGDQYWLSGVKKRGMNRHVFGHGKILVSRDALADFLALKGWDRLDETRYDLFDVKPTDIARFSAMENAKLGSA